MKLGTVGVGVGMVADGEDHIIEGLSSPKSGLIAQTQCEFTLWCISSLLNQNSGWCIRESEKIFTNSECEIKW